jgi:acetyl esterase/lipase
MGFIRNAAHSLVKCEASTLPVAYGQVAPPQSVPPFLVINAATDLGLEVDGQRFYSELVARGVQAERAVIAGTNHGTVTRNPVALATAVKFIRAICEREDKAVAESA